jgi:hypothetical protein
LWAIAAFSVEARLLGALARQSNIWVEAFAAGGARSKGADTGFKPVQAGFGRYDAISSGWGLNMQRRDFIALLGSAAALPIAAIDAEADLGLTGIELGS